MCKWLSYDDKWNCNRDGEDSDISCPYFEETQRRCEDSSKIDFPSFEWRGLQDAI